MNNNLKTSLKAWFSSLPDRDATALKYLLVFLLVVMLYFSCLLPSIEYKNKAEAVYLSNSELLTWMRENEPFARSLSDEFIADEESSIGSILSIVDSSSKDYNIILQKYEPNNENGIRVWLEDANFNDLVNWLAELNRNFNIHISQINIDKNSAEGYVDSNVELSRM